VPLNDIVNAIKEALSEHKDIDVLTLTANGEPTLYPYLNELIEQINSFKGNIKTLILTNSSTINESKVQEALKKLDSVKLSLDCATQKCFKKLDRASKNIDLEEIKKGILEFSKNYKGNLIIEILFVKGINDNLEEVEKLNNFLLKLKPTRVDLSTIDRPPAFDIKPISYDKLYELSLGFDKSLPIVIASRATNDSKLFNYSKSEILNTLSMRPLTLDDINKLFTKESIDKFNELLKDGKIEKVNSLGVEFYRSKE
jgi:wyosine [tRNA(Phe)-imidazoG37] synthetase (radical SAM superfamily)